MQFANPQYLVTTDWLAENLDNPHVRILDVTAKLTSSLVNRAKEECYDQGHIPGSLFFDVSSGNGVLSATEADLPWMWPGPEQITATIAAVGVGQKTKVVLVAASPREGIDSGTMWCTRAWWTLHHYGVDCAILQGGIERWTEEGRQLSTEVEPVPEVAGFEPATGWEAARATKDDVLAAVEGRSDARQPVCIVDALPADSFDGTGTAYGPRGGHITGATNVPFRSLISAETADFVDADTMHRNLTEAGLLGEAPVITYCGGAIAATVDAFALALFNKTDVSVYDGSLMEWSADPALPMTDPSDPNNTE